jgi:hypothetical protein
MKTKALIILLFFCVDATAQLRGFIEQIYYVDAAGKFSVGPLAALQNDKNWYLETRYNYEEKRSLSLYVGKAFQGGNEFSFSIIPIVGGVVGRYKGGSAGLNVALEYKRFFFESQSQYTFSAKDEVENFFFSWSELGYQPRKWFYGGLAMQPTYYPHTKNNSLSPGFMMGFSFGKWSLPLYMFNPFSNERAFVCSIIKTWGKNN